VDMDFSWTEEQLLLKESVITFAQAELNDAMIERDKKGEISRENWKKCAEHGILGLPIPEKYGGINADILTTTLVMEGLGYGCKDNGLIFAMNAQLWSVQQPILLFGTEEQKLKYLPGMSCGELFGAHGMSEPGSGSDAYSLATRAERSNGGYVINGTKTLITNSPFCDFALIFTTVDASKGIGGITAFLVDKGTPGFHTGPKIDKMGLRTAEMGELIFEDCYVPDENCLGKEGMGTAIFNSSMEWERSSILASHIGAMQRQLETCIRYARQRRQFGQIIGKFQSVSNRIADMKVRLETARLLLYQVAWLKKTNKSAVMEAAIAKLYISECFVQSSLDAIRIHGGYGYMTEVEVERDLRDSIGGLLYSGTSDIQRNIISRWLGL